MTINILYTFEYAEQDDLSFGLGSVFLAGPTPRSEDVESWRPEIVREFKAIGEDLTVFLPEYGGIVQDEGNSYEDQCNWEWHHLHAADVVLFWIPRDMDVLPGFTTNCEFGYWVEEDHTLYGRPPNAPKTKYLDWLYQKAFPDKRMVSESIEDLAKRTIKYLKARKNG